MNINAFDIAQRFIGTDEVGGQVDNPQIMAMLRLDAEWPENDEVPWCSAFVNYVCWLLRLPRSKSLRARSWLLIGRAIKIDEAVAGDIVILKRGGANQPGPEVINAQGHVGFFAGYAADDANLFYKVEVLGGNQSNQVKLQTFEGDRILGVRRLVG